MRYCLKLLIACILGVFSLALSQNALAQKEVFTVVIDPGHGGRDPGALGAKTKEKDIVLAVGKKLGDLISKNHKDVKVVYTRSTDKSVGLSQRAEIANKAKADLFISIHCNAIAKRSKSPQGVETFVLGLHRSKDNLDVAKAENSVILYEDDYSTKYQGFDPNEPESYIIFEFMTDQYLQQSIYFASIVQNKLVTNSKRINRNVRQAGFLVLREVAMPSILIELGYISNISEERYMKSASGQNSLANSIYQGFKQYKREYDKKSYVFTNNTPEPNRVNTSPEAIAVPPETGNDSISEYRIQILISSEKLEANSKHFKGLSPIDYYTDGGLYKYTYGKSHDFDEINKTLKDVAKKFTGAFIIEFKNGQRIK